MWFSKSEITAGFLALFLSLWLSWIGIGLTKETPCKYIPERYIGLEPGVLEEELSNNGLIGRIHGAVPEAGLFLMTVRDPNNFFQAINYSLVPENAKVLETLNSLNRHDRICLKGEFLTNPSPQKHIHVKKISVFESWPQPKNLSDYEREVKLPLALKGKNEFIGKVHAIDAQGTILVLEYGDAILPVFVKQAAYTKELYRGDIVKVHFRRQEKPGLPLHLNLDPEVDPPLEVLERIASLHGKKTVMEGRLVKFPQSPQLKFDVFAIEKETWGTKRNFTLVNFQDSEKFRQIREKLAKIWQKHPQTIVKGRNMLINPQLNLKVQGTVNVVSPQQANPQILLESSESIELIDKT